MQHAGAPDAQEVLTAMEGLNKTHTVLKPMIPQIGVAAAVRRDRKPNLVPDVQQDRSPGHGPWADATPDALAAGDVGLRLE
ncbi:unnamed protein product [Cladocopium goreaui]|uniref:Uncharacterized protein n=1 Tax=Cladocopium goreaui TaxID=2562237 RepID=A0A9P1BK77_9DINO|nr:unnamed protein product [Cladocopium goreaui]